MGNRCCTSACHQSSSNRHRHNSPPKFDNSGKLLHQHGMQHSAHLMGIDPSGGVGVGVGVPHSHHNLSSTQHQLHPRYTADPNSRLGSGDVIRCSATTVAATAATTAAGNAIAVPPGSGRVGGQSGGGGGATPTRPSISSSNSQQQQQQNSGKQRILVAQYHYLAHDVGDLSFRKGDRMELLDDSDGDWWKVVHLGTNDVGLIPGNFVAAAETVECEEWFFDDVSRKEADKLLLSDGNPRGTFLVRPSEHNPHGYSLSVKDWEEIRGSHVKHYKIKPLDNGGYYISTNKTFTSLADLVQAYSKNSLGLCHVLTLACPKPQPQVWDLGPALRDHYEIPRSEVVLIRPLGRGNFGEVYYGKWRNSIDVAVKTLRQGTMSTAAFLQEAAIMKQLRHKQLVRLYAVCTHEEPIYIVTEYMSRGSLLDFLRQDEGQTLEFEELVYMAYQVAAGMEYLESRQLIHRDLAARNVLVGDNHIAKICDFGLARVIEDNEYCPRQGSRFPVKWTAPEAIIYGRFSIKSDVWSYGILLMELFTFGQVPYPGMQAREVTEQVEKGYRMPKPPHHHLPDDIYRTMLACWDAKAENRPTFEFLAHYFEGFSVTSEIPYREVQD